MSGDVQPRKRKDKKRKKEEEPSTTPPVHVFSKEPSEDVNIHIHKEEGTGGGICAKIIFFILFSALIVLIGLIITEHRGLTDLDVAESESKYSQIFEGWVDNAKHDDHHTLDDHDNEHFDDEEHEDDGHTLDDHDDDHMDDEETDEQSEEEHTLDDHDNEHFDDDESSPPSEENEDDAEYQQEESQSQEEYTEKFRKNGRYRRQVSEEDDDDNITDSQEAQKVDNSKIYINTKASSSSYDDEEAVDSKDEDDIEDRSENLYEDEENSKVQQDDNIDDSAEILEDDDNVNDSGDETDFNEDSETEDTEVYSKTSDEEINAEYDSQVDEDDNTITSTSKMVDDVIKNEEYASEEAADELDNESNEENNRKDTSAEKSAEEPEKIEDNEEKEVYMNDKSKGNDQEIYEKSDIPKKSVSDSNESTEENIIQQIENKDTEYQDNDHENGNSGGSDNPGSLSNNSPDETNGRSKQIHIDLSRRNTLIPPPPLQEIEHDVESGDKEYYDDEEADDGGAVGSRSVTDVSRKKYEQLRSNYSRSISAESDIGHDPKHNESEDELEIEDIEEEELDEEEEEEEEDVDNLQGEEMEDVEDEDIDDEDYENEEYEEDDDEELMKKLEAKYGKLKLEPKTKERTPSTDLDESDSEKLSDDNNEYEFAGITNKDDWQIRKELDEAQLNLRNNAAYALKMFEKVLEKYPSSPRGFYGLAQALDALADKEKSNELLEEAISNYFKVSEMKNVPDPLYKASLERCIDRTRFRGKYGKAIRVHLKLINRFPDQPEYRNQLTITYLTIGKVEEARSVLEETLQKWPYNGCALVHYGFIWKTTDNNLEKGVSYMQKGIDTQDPCTIDGRFYFHLGDGYSRLGDSKKALKVYQEGVDHKLFLSKYQRSLYNVPRLTARPWWENNQLPKYNILLEDLEKHWIAIKNEGLAVLNQQGFFQDESENLKDTGDWKQFELFARGRRNIKNCNKTPFTCKLVGSHIDASGCRRGQTKFSVMHPGTHVWSHCGPTNCRLRIHLGLKVPPKTFIRVEDTVRSWNAGKLLIFDDSFEHEVWHNGTDIRLVLIVDVWHPELTMTEKENLSSL